MRTSGLAFAIVGLAAALACSTGTTTLPPPPPPPAQPPPPPPPPPPPQPPPPPPPPPPGSGTVTVTYTSPRTDDGAILFELKGPSIHGITPTGTNLQIYVDSTTSPIRVVAFGAINSGALLTFTIADTATFSSYGATLVDVANRQNDVRSSLTGYALTVTH
jgi:hypothetical protein